MAGFMYRDKDHRLLRRATLVLTVERTPRFRFGLWLIVAAMWLGTRFMGCGFEVNRAEND